MAAAGGACLLGLGLSASIEMLQVFDTSRTSSLLDVACNFAGAAGGACAALIFEEEILRHHAAAAQAIAGQAARLLLACCWAGYQLYPFIPHLGRTAICGPTWRSFLATRVSPVEVYASAAEWFAFALVLRAVSGRRSTLWLPLAMSCLPLRLVIDGTRTRARGGDRRGARDSAVDLSRRRHARARRRDGAGRGDRAARVVAVRVLGPARAM